MGLTGIGAARMLPVARGLRGTHAASPRHPLHQLSEITGLLAKSTNVS
jgi:hypothetical protein